MKRLRLYLILLGLLGAFSIYFFLSRHSGTYSPSKQEFAVADTGSVDYIVISSGSEEVNITKRRGAWLVNGKQARRESIRGLFVVISRLEVESPVSKADAGRINSGLDQLYTEVRIGMNNGNEKTYRVYYDLQSDASYMILEGSDLAFRVSVRGYRQNNLLILFNADPRFWRDNLIFSVLPAEIKAVSLLNNVQEEKSFHLARNVSGGFDIAAGMVPSSWVPASGDRVTQYLEYFYNVRFEFFRDPGNKTLIHSDIPDYSLMLELMDGQRISVELFPVAHNEDGGEPQADYDRLYARIIQGDEWLVVKYVQIDLLLKEFKYFTAL